MSDDVDFRIQFIREVEKNPCLYDPQSDDYNNKLVMDKVWGQISKMFGEQVSDCKSKWRSIRCAYNRTLGSQSRNYYLAEHLRFLNPFLKCKVTDKNDGSKSGGEDEESVDNQEADGTPSNYEPHPTSPEGPRIKEELDDEIYDSNLFTTLDDRNSLLVKRRRPSQPDWLPGMTSPSSAKKKKIVKSSHRRAAEHYALSLVPYLETMNQRQQLVFQRGVIDLIERIKYGSDPK